MTTVNARFDGRAFIPEGSVDLPTGCAVEISFSPPSTPAVSDRPLVALAEIAAKKRVCYAEAAIPDYWIVNLVDCRVEVRRNPSNGVYESLKIIEAEGEVRPLLFPGCPLPANLLF